MRAGEDDVEVRSKVPKDKYVNSIHYESKLTYDHTCLIRGWY
jgi:hypothetical protein